MYNYSPIESIYIRNFRNLGDVELSFKDSPIITLVGENESGKTSVIKAVATCALHANPKEQKDYIRDGTKMFGIAIKLEDGTVVKRIKELSGVNSYQILDANNNLVYSTGKISEGLPMEVQKIMGLIAEPETNEFLHIRTYEDKLLFVVTPNSTNYKVMYNALKVEQLTKAIKIGSMEANSLKSNINTNEASIETLYNQISGINIYDVEPLKNIRNSVKEQLGHLDKIEKIINLLSKVEDCEKQLGALALIDRYKLDTIDEVLSFKLNNANKLFTKLNESSILLNKLGEISNLQEINTDSLTRLYNIISKIDTIDERIHDAKTLTEVNELCSIDEILVSNLNKVSSLIENEKKLVDSLSKIDVRSCEIIKDEELQILDKASKVINLNNSIDANKNQLESFNKYIEDIYDYLKKCGVAFETCPNCGNDVLIDMDKVGY